MDQPGESQRIVGEGLKGTSKPHLLATKINAWQASNHPGKGVFNGALFQDVRLLELARKIRGQLPIFNKK